MKIGIFITARLGSTRLARKHLLPVGGKPILSYLAGRIVRGLRSEMRSDRAKLLIVTSDEPENRLFEEFTPIGLEVFYGSVHNIPLRHLQAAEDRGLDAVVSVDGDDILCSVKGMRMVYDALMDGRELVRTSNLPFGMNSMGYSRAFLERSLRNHREGALETGWGRIFEGGDMTDIAVPFPIQNEILRFTLDYQEDYVFFKALIEELGGTVDSASDEDIVSTVMEKKLYALNEPISREYWSNFYKARDEEIRRSRIPPTGTGGIRLMNRKGPELWERAKTIIPGGGELLSKRSERFLPGLWPAYYSRAKGCEVWDLEGNHYYDLAQMGVGSCILGYADDDVNTAVMNAVRDGSMCSLNCWEEVSLAEKLIALHPWADMARFSRTGGEACAIAVRIGRAATGRDKVAFCGYHGWHDWYISANLGDTSNLDGQLLPGLEPLGVPRRLHGTALPFNYNCLQELESIIGSHPGEIGVIVMEPLRGSAPDPGFLEGVRAAADRIGAVLIFDEVTSGFRMNVGGIHMRLGVTPDIAVFGKALGNGFPISAVIGRREIMESADETFISSTFWTERIGFAAALASLNKMEELGVHDHLVRYGELLNRGWNMLAGRYDLKIAISGIPPLTHLAFEEKDAAALQTLYTQEMLKKGYLLGASVYTSYAYSEGMIDRFVADSDSVFALMRRAVSSGDTHSFLEGPPAYSGFKRLT